MLVQDPYKLDDTFIPRGYVGYIEGKKGEPGREWRGTRKEDYEAFDPETKVRAMDFELPDVWMEKPDLFLFKSYDEKKAMIEDLRQPITVEMVLQEINRYADSEFRYADKSDEVAIENAVREMGRMEEAKRRYLEGKG